jgi:hypothetical protein
LKRLVAGAGQRRERGLEIDELCRAYPRLYHMATAGSWPNLRERGLLSTTALLDLFEVRGAERATIESVRRPESVRLTHRRHGGVVVRDQKPMTDAKVAACVRGMTPAEWYRLLNGKVYFWLSERRLGRMLGARPYRGDEHCVLTLDTRSLVTAHAARITLSPINSGAMIRNPPPRGRETFAPIGAYPFDAWRRKRGKADAVVELAVEYSVSDVGRHVIAVERRRGTEVLETLWRR